ncbi:acylphosphatase [Sphingomonas soli]|uniref:acylphosphatase n=1 Tax=Sphingomonas soli TaxID=266127 RepID=UPI00082E6BA3|nr:acylphosphatase [Sphingomonas soli]
MAIKRILVSGRVQAVGFRDWVVRTAKAEGITGWVRNRNDGSVEMIASGEDDAVTRFADACREGPALARVDHVEVLEAAGEKPGKGFTKRFTA